MDNADLVREYEAGLQQALKGEPADGAALGEAAAAAHLGLDAVLATHQRAVLDSLKTGRPEETIRRASAFLAAFVEPLDRARARLASQTRALEQLPEVLLEGIPAIGYVARWQGEPGEMLYVSPQSEAILGYSMPDWVGEPGLWRERLEPEDRDRVLAERAVARSERAAFVSEYRLRSRRGRAIWFHDEARLVLDEEGQPLFWQGVLLDITERKVAEEEAAEAERMRLARELHDSVAQSLLAVTVHARTLPRVWRVDPQDAEARLADLETLASTALAELRMLLLELRPTELTRVALPHLLTQLATAMRSRCAAPIRLSLDPVPLLPPHVQLAFYRVAQEALNNAARHAAATEIRVSLSYKGGKVVLTIADDGQGFDPDNLPPGHFGVRGMRERAHEVGATLILEGGLAHGASVGLVWRMTEGGR